MTLQNNIRINIILNPDKDDVLYHFMASIPTDARARRLINMATIGSVVAVNHKTTATEVSDRKSKKRKAKNNIASNLLD
jgi:hypothetical protein